MRKWIFKCLFLIGVIGCNSKEPHFKEIHFKHREFKDFIVVDDQIFALDVANNLVQINPISEGYRFVESQVHAFGPWQGNGIIIVTQSGVIKTYDLKKNAWTKRGATAVEVEGIIPVDDNIYLWTELGILDYETGKFYTTDSSCSYNRQIKNSGLPPNSIAVDDDKNIWLGFDIGEWGGDLVVFNTQNKKYLYPQLAGMDFNLMPMQAILAGDEAVYLLFGSLYLPLGPILEVKDFSSKTVFQPKEKRVKVIYEDGTEGYSIKRPFEIGAGAIDKEENKIYFSTFFGNKIWEGDLSRDLSKESSWEVISNLEEYLNQNDLDSEGFPMIDNVLITKLEKMKDGNFVFLHFENGIGYLNLNRGQLKVFK